MLITGLCVLGCIVYYTIVKYVEYRYFKKYIELIREDIENLNLRESE